MTTFYECPKLKPQIKSMSKGALFYLYCSQRDFHPTAKDCSKCTEDAKREIG